jgi:transglutaminase/protease-like cytokinesis protein 3
VEVIVMATKLIQLEDGILVEVEVPENQAQPIASGLADKVSTTLDKIKPVLIKVCRPIAEVWQEMNQEMDLERAEVEVGFSFEAEGSIYVTKAKGSSNLTVKLVLKPKARL